MSADSIEVHGLCFYQRAPLTLRAGRRREEEKSLGTFSRP
jgi:hypothetical protein